jgi:hypothetical protein
MGLGNAIPFALAKPLVRAASPTGEEKRPLEEKARRSDRSKNLCEQKIILKVKLLIQMQQNLWKWCFGASLSCEKVVKFI